jgi:hypothetical protein
VPTDFTTIGQDFGFLLFSFFFDVIFFLIGNPHFLSKKNLYSYHIPILSRAGISSQKLNKNRDIIAGFYWLSRLNTCPFKIGIFATLKISKPICSPICSVRFPFVSRPASLWSAGLPTNYKLPLN